MPTHVAAAAVAAVTSLAAKATTATTAATASTAKPVSATSLFFQLILGLAVVLAIIWVAARVLRGRVGTMTTRRRDAALSVLGRQPLGKGVQVVIVKAGADTHLLGVTAHTVTRLAAFEPDASEPPETSTDDLPPASAGVAAAHVGVTSSIQSTVRQLQERTLRRR